MVDDDTGNSNDGNNDKVVSLATVRQDRAVRDRRRRDTANVTDLIAKLPIDEQKIANLLLLSAVERERMRVTIAKELGLRPAIVDKLLNEIANRLDLGSSSWAVNLVEPASEPQELTTLVNDIMAAIRRHVWMTDDQALVVALWALHTWVFDCFDHTPRLGIVSTAPRYGKSTLLDLLAEVCHNPLEAGSVTAAVVKRVVERNAPTLLLDEFDLYGADNKELRNVVNTGYHFNGSAWSIEIGPRREKTPVRFSTFSPVAIAAIGKLPRTIADRSIHIRMEQKGRGVSTDRLNKAAKLTLRPLAARAARWANDCADALVTSVHTPDPLNDRMADVSIPLLSIADAAGCGDQAREALVTLTFDTDGLDVVLLGKVVSAFNDSNVEYLTPTALLEHLTDDSNFDGLTSNALGRALGKFGIKRVRPSGETSWIYLREQVLAVWRSLAGP